MTEATNSNIKNKQEIMYNEWDLVVYLKKEIPGGWEWNKKQEIVIKCITPTIKRSHQVLWWFNFEGVLVDKQGQKYQFNKGESYKVYEAITNGCTFRILHNEDYSEITFKKVLY